MAWAAKWLQLTRTPVRKCIWAVQHPLGQTRIGQPRFWKRSRICPACTSRTTIQGKYPFWARPRPCSQSGVQVAADRWKAPKECCRGRGRELLSVLVTVVCNYGLIFRRWEDGRTGHETHQQLCLPRKLAPQVLCAFQDNPSAGRLGVTKILERVRKRFHWLGAWAWKCGEPCENVCSMRSSERSTKSCPKLHW